MLEMMITLFCVILTAGRGGGGGGGGGALPYLAIMGMRR